MSCSYKTDKEVVDGREKGSIKVQEGITKSEKLIQSPTETMKLFTLIAEVMQDRVWKGRERTSGLMVDMLFLHILYNRGQDVYSKIIPCKKRDVAIFFPFKCVIQKIFASHLLQKDPIHTHWCLTVCVSSTTTLRDYENNVSCELQALLGKVAVTTLKILLAFHHILIFILTTVWVGTFTWKRNGLDFHPRPAPCLLWSELLIQVRWNDDKFFQVFRKQEKLEVWEYFKAIFSQQPQWSAAGGKKTCFAWHKSKCMQNSWFCHCINVAALCMTSSLKKKK